VLLTKIKDRAVAGHEGKQALRVEEGVGPTLMIAATAATFTAAALAQDAAQPAADAAICFSSCHPLWWMA
jgi:hypothetical protein